MPEFTYGEILLKCSPEIVIMMQPLPMLEKLNLEIEEEEVVTVDDLNNNSLDHQSFTVSESSNISAQPASNQEYTMENAMDMEDVLDFEPSEEEEEEVTVVAKEAEVEVAKEKKKRQRRGRAVLRKKKIEQQEEQNVAEEEEDSESQ